MDLSSRNIRTTCPIRTNYMSIHIKIICIHTKMVCIHIKWYVHAHKMVCLYIIYGMYGEQNCMYTIQNGMYTYKIVCTDESSRPVVPMFSFCGRLVNFLNKWSMVPIHMVNCSGPLVHFWNTEVHMERRKYNITGFWDWFRVSSELFLSYFTSAGRRPHEW
jgi:hypothetical protein